MLRRQTSCNEPSPKDLGMVCLPLLAVRHDVNKCQQMMRCIYIAFDGLSNARAAGISWSIWIYLGVISLVISVHFWKGMGEAGK